MVSAGAAAVALSVVPSTVAIADTMSKPGERVAIQQLGKQDVSETAIAPRRSRLVP